MVKEYFKKIKELGIGKLLLILLAGILLVLSCFMDTPDEAQKENANRSLVGIEQQDGDILSSSMEELLSQVQGVTNVKVLVTYEDSGKKILESSKNTEEEKTTEQDSAGGIRTEERNASSQEYLYAGETPYVVMETKPSICGVVVVYEGDKNMTKDITEAVKVLTGVDYNRIKVLYKN